MLNESSDSEDWQQELNFRRWLRDQGVTPYTEARKWKRRFWMALFVDVILSILLLMGAGSNR